MSRRRRKSSPFTLFSFQDIVTSVTAVIILITLILALELITRQPNSAAGQLGDSVTQLRVALDQAELERRSLESRLQQDESRTVEQAGTTPELLRRDLDHTKEQVARLRQELEQLRTSLRSAKAAEDAALASSLNHNASREELTDLEKKAATANDQREQIHDEGQLIFNRPVGTSKQAWLVDVSADTVIVLPFTQASERHEFHSSFLNPCIDQMLAWVRSERNSQGDYFVLLVRPSGIENADKLRDALSNRGFEIGRDMVGATQKVTTKAPKVPR